MLPVRPPAPPRPPPASSAGATLLRAADERVDVALSSASRVYANNSAYLTDQLAKQKQFHAANLETYRTAREAYLKKVRSCASGAPG